LVLLVQPVLQALPAQEQQARLVLKDRLVQALVRQDKLV
jgi:hypothetical protein